MKLKKNRDLKTCNAMRCARRVGLVVNAAGTIYPEEEGPIALCQVHQDKAVHQGSLEIPPAPETEALLVQEAAEAVEILDMVRAFEIVDQDTMGFAEECSKDTKVKIKALAAKKKEAVGPLNQALKTVRGWFRPAEDHYRECEKIWKAKIAAYARAQAEAQRAALEAVQTAHQAGDVQEVAQAMAKASEATVEIPKSISIRSVWRCEIANPTEVPQEYLSPDMDKIKAAVKAGAREIPGVKIWEDSSVTQRT